MRSNLTSPHPRCGQSDDDRIAQYSDIFDALPPSGSVPLPGDLDNPHCHVYNPRTIMMYSV